MAIRDPFPLSWPEGWTRTKKHAQARAKFAASWPSARDAVVYEIGRIHGANLIITSNVRVNHRGVTDGRTDGQIPDPGVAVWWQERGGVERVIACDRWLTPGENLRAIAKSLEALRGIHRWGASQIVDRAFSGFNSLPAAGDAHVEEDWWEVLEVEADRLKLDPDELLAITTMRFKKLAANAHPDRGGSTEAMARLNGAYERAKQHIDVLKGEG